MFVGSDDGLASECEGASPALLLLRVAHAAAAVERMLVTRPLVVVVDESVSDTDLVSLIECAADIRAEVIRAPAARRDSIAAEVRSAIPIAEKNRIAADAPRK
jgi:hypothetical protein